MKKVIFCKGMMEVLDYFIDQMIIGAKQLGVDYYVLDASNPQTYNDPKFDEFVNSKEAFVLTFNQMGLLLNDESGNFWKNNDVPIFDFIVDHPMHYADGLDNPPAEVKAIVLDRNHEKFVRKYYRNIKDVLFLPNGGTMENANIALKERGMDIIYPGGCNVVKNVREIDLFSDGGKEFYNVVTQTVKDNPYLTVEQGMELYFDYRKIEDYEVRKYLLTNFASPISDAVQRHFKLKIMHAIEKTGVQIDIYGNGWEDEKQPWKDNVHIHSRVDSKTCNQLIGNAKMGLNCMPWFKDGCSERVFNIMLNKAMCLTNTSDYLLDRFSHGKELVFFNLDNLDELSENVEWLFNNQTAMEEIANEGHRVACENDTWAHRFKRIYDFAQEVMK